VDDLTAGRIMCGGGNVALRLIERNLAHSTNVRHVLPYRH